MKDGWDFVVLTLAALMNNHTTPTCASNTKVRSVKLCDAMVTLHGTFLIDSDVIFNMCVSTNPIPNDSFYLQAEDGWYNTWSKNSFPKLWQLRSIFN
jgi:hypothetical protein